MVGKKLISQKPYNIKLKSLTVLNSFDQTISQSFLYLYAYIYATLSTVLHCISQIISF